MEKPHKPEPVIFISGHRNPDVDSVMSAVALADLKKRLGYENVQAICPGLIPDKAAWLFEHFKLTPPPCRTDVFVRVQDLVHPEYARIPTDAALLDAVQTLRENHAKGLPVTDAGGNYLGMLTPFSLLNELMNIGSDEGRSLTGREVYSSTAIIKEILDAELLSGNTDNVPCKLDVYVAAMSQEFFEKHLDAASSENEQAIIVGDRPEIHLRLLQRNVKLLIITGNCPVESAIIELAKQKNVTILRTSCDSATVIRRLKFSVPVRYATLNKKTIILSPDDLIRDVRSDLLDSRDDVFPVCHDGKLLGVISRSVLSAPPPFKMILVDHNEIDQGLPGLEDLPVIEVVDHHRIGFKPTIEPIRFTADTVGSTCTLVAGMFRSSGFRPSKGIAGLLLGGIITDTLLFQSPTSTKEDHAAAEWLESICGEKAADLMEGLMKLNSLLSVKSSAEVIEADRKNYHENGYSFALSQVEENNLEMLHRRQADLLQELEHKINAEGLDFIALLATDAVRGNSELLIAGTKNIIRALPFRRRPDGIFLLPGILSRKKQLLPQILSVTASVQKK